MNSTNLAARLEARLLCPDLRLEAVLDAAERAARAGIGSVLAAPIFTADLAARLEAAPAGGQTSPLPGAVAAHPIGAVPVMMRSISATQAAKAGARIIETAAWRPAILDLLEDQLYDDLLMLVRSVRSVRGSIRIHVAIDVAALRAAAPGASALDERLRFACRAVRETGCDAIVTESSGRELAREVGTGVEDVRALRRCAGDFPIKATGALGDSAAAQSLLDAGADMLSCADFEAALTQAR